MNSSNPIIVEVVVDESERPAVTTAMEQLVESLHAAAGGGEWAIRINFRGSMAAIDLARRPTVVITSLLSELARRDEPLALTEMRWRANLSLLVEAQIPGIFITTIFRHLGHGGKLLRGKEGADRQSTLERIRRLNLLAIELSHDTGIGVIDIDRAFAHIGARLLNADNAASRRVAAEVAGHTIVASILSVGLDDVVPPEIQERVKELQGNLWNIDRLIQRRLNASLQRQARAAR